MGDDLASFQCNLCLDRLGSKGGVVSLIPCLHSFCSDCIACEINMETELMTNYTTSRKWSREVDGNTYVAMFKPASKIPRGCRACPICRSPFRKDTGYARNHMLESVMDSMFNVLIKAEASPQHVRLSLCQ